jgi:hypothetical protein
LEVDIAIHDAKEHHRCKLSAPLELILAICKSPFFRNNVRTLPLHVVLLAETPIFEDPTHSSIMLDMINVEANNIDIL